MPNAPPEPKPPPPNSFAADLTAATLASERRRIALQGVLLVICLAVYCCYFLARRAVGAAMWAGLNRQTPAVFTVYATAIVYEAVLWLTVGARLRTGRPTPALLSYINAAVEVSFFTVLLWIASHVFDPAEAMFFPPSLLYLVVIALSTLRLNPRLSAFTGFVAAAEYAALALPIARRVRATHNDDWLVQPLHHLIRAGAFALGGLAAAFIAAQIRRQIEQSVRSLQERDRAISVFGQHVSPEVAGRLLAQAADLSPEVREVCVMFLDIRDFTRFSQGRGPEEVMDYLNKLFNPMIDVVNRHGGIINKFLGDGFMAVFGAPVEDGEGSRHAARAALELVARVAEMTSSGAVPPRASASACTRAEPSPATSARPGARSTPSSATW